MHLSSMDGITRHPFFIPLPALSLDYSPLIPPKQYDRKKGSKTCDVLSLQRMERPGGGIVVYQTLRYVHLADLSLAITACVPPIFCGSSTVIINISIGRGGGCSYTDLESLSYS